MSRRSAEAEAWQAWYKTARWRAIRAAQLQREPLCRLCREADRVTAASVCDHVTPHRGIIEAFWFGPFQSLCDSCHSSVKQGEEARGYRKGVDINGRPLDPNHPWNRPHVH